MIKNWMLADSVMFGVDGIAFPDKQILIPITIKHKEVPNFTLNQWLVTNVFNAVRINYIDCTISLATYDYSNCVPEWRRFENKSKRGIACYVLSITQKTLTSLLPKIPKKYCEDLWICEIYSNSNRSYRGHEKVWVLGTGKNKIVL